MPYKYTINGGARLKGAINVGGCKNAAVAILPAATMVRGVCRIENVPRISDIYAWLDILTRMGVSVRSINETTVEIDSTSLRSIPATFDVMREMRASYYLIGALLSRFGEAQVSMPGGCDFGVRPIDQHIKGFRSLGSDIEVRNGIIHAKAEHLAGNHVYMDVVSVGATINVMLAATLADGMTVIENAAKEPHIVDVANFLNSMGADIKGAGTDMIKINGVRELHGGTYSIIPDQIEAGTYMVLAAATESDLLINNVIPKHLECITAKLREIGADVEELDEAVRVCGNGRPGKAMIKTMPHPGFPTDMQPQIATLLALADGTSVVTEGVYDNRFRYVDELRRMGAHIQVDGKVAVIEGVAGFTGAAVRACDLRAGAALVIAGLAAAGRTEIEGVSHIERGYEMMIEKLCAVGADISVREIETPSVIREAL